MKVALTFDVEKDIPKFLDTNFGLNIGLIKILDLLDEFQIKGTFFCTGNVAEQNPQIINLIESKNHEIACHGLKHERLYQLKYEECRNLISNSKTLLEKKCQKSKIIGFRAPYLKPPKFIFNLLNELNFKYDSSIPLKNHFKVDYSNYEVKEFHPISNSYFLFRLPLFYHFLRRKIFKRNFSLLYFHSWEAIDIKELLRSKKTNLRIKNLLFRIDRWFKTGDKFLNRLRKFIIECQTKDTKFVLLREIVENDEE